jgi:hypothetical protein
MALDSTVLREEMATQISLKGLPIIDKETLDAISIAIVNHITSAAVVTVGASTGTIS